MYSKTAIILTSILTLASAAPKVVNLPKPIEIVEPGQGPAPGAFDGDTNEARCLLFKDHVIVRTFEVYVPIDMVNRDEECGKTYKAEYNRTCPGVTAFSCDMLDENGQVLSNNPKEEGAAGMIMKFNVSAFCVEPNIGMAVGKASAAEGKGVECTR